MHNFVGRRRERERQIGIRRQRLAFPFSVDHVQQRIEPRRAEPFGEFEILQLAQQVGLPMHQFFKLRDGDLVYPRPGIVEIHRLVVIARGSANRQGWTSHLDTKVVEFVHLGGMRWIERESVEASRLRDTTFDVLIQEVFIGVLIRIVRRVN